MFMPFFRMECNDDKTASRRLSFEYLMDTALRKEI